MVSSCFGGAVVVGYVSCPVAVSSVEGIVCVPVEVVYVEGCLDGVPGVVSYVSCPAPTIELGRLPLAAGEPEREPCPDSPLSSNLERSSSSDCLVSDREGVRDLPYAVCESMFNIRGTA